MAAAATVGLDLGGTKCLGILLSADGTVLDEHRVPTPRGTDAVVEALARTAEELIARAGDTIDVAAVGAGVPGLVDGDGVLRFAPNLPGVTDAPVAALLAKRLSRPVRLENDASCAAWGEKALGAARGRDHVVCVTLGTGIGGGIVTEGRLYRGANGFAGEIGHMVVDPDGPPCPCGRRGCWERYASGSGLGRLAREAAQGGRARRAVELAGGDPEDVKGDHLTTAALAGDEESLAVFSTFAWWVALGLANLANIFDPSCFVVGGGLVRAGDLLLDRVRQSFDTLVEAPEHRPAIPIVAAELGEQAGAMGAASLAALDDWHR